MRDIDLSSELYNQARLAYQAGACQDALALLEKSVVIKDHFKARELMAVCHRMLGNTSKSIDHLALIDVPTFGDRYIQFRL